MCIRARIAKEDRTQGVAHGQEEVAALGQDCQENSHYASNIKNLNPQAPEYDVIPTSRARITCTEEEGTQGGDPGQETVASSHDCT